LNATLARGVDASAVLWRPLADTDIEAVVALEREAHAAPWTAGNFRDALAAGYGVAVGAVDGVVVAYGVLLFAPGEVQLLNLTVAPAARRLGIGRTLLRRFLADARARGAAQCFLEVRVSNEVAIALYATEGFAPVGRRAAYYPAQGAGPREDALVMRRALATD
jgi:ribosomal-protein-alanine acetyltransferase